ncbi:hypothetical protein ACFC0M_36995 [Streptomyces sp. NPDC056149]|uniref:hypothetical protein n=1 Tax=Streptomyces sp. NPDC056149 TaxID=3345728 RepID=UPI0035E29BA7
MPQLPVRPEVVVLLTDVDLSRADDPSRLFHRDGRPFTAAEHYLLTTLTPEEIAAAKAQTFLEYEWTREINEMKAALANLLMKYSTRLPKGSLVGDAVAIMTDEDYAEYEHLVGIVTAEDPLKYRAGRARN